MTTTPAAVAVGGDRTEATTWIDRARAFAPRIEGARDALDRHRRVPSELLGAMVDAGLFRLSVPRAYGGAEVGLPTLCRVIEEVSAADGSVGWTLMVGNGNGFHAGYLPEAAAAEVYGADARALVAGSGLARRARAVPIAGGYRLEGRWALASGCLDAAWLAGAAPVPAAGGAPELHVFFLPRSAATVVDTWDAAGLRATASHDFEAHAAFVPEWRHYAAFAPGRLPGPLWRDTFVGVVAHGVAPVALGLARAAIDELRRLAATKTPAACAAPLRERPAVQAQVARAEALLRAARAFFYETLESVWETACRGDGPSPEQAAVSQLARTHAAQSCAEAVDLMYAAAGSTALYATDRIARCFRDVHAVTQHMAVSPLGWAQAGRHFLGQSPGGR